MAVVVQEVQEALAPAGKNMALLETQALLNSSGLLALADDQAVPKQRLERLPAASMMPCTEFVWLYLGLFISACWLHFDVKHS